ncbi:hypothetical protein [Nonomuraea gerenzanensis]|uniref:Uncharacterized protein n=1 Tax=Nonomuraea gerenzanensis TaxID=93944 RepID=A0A1M4DY53_9ACTN|nr:hypothetical protein [Nonomuraea gerenzanensis]UBU13760.1 hypothetical protein LCN96_01595 [Nonomuraea gerenzanensis]SBO91430.1 hypothetical protein BN4615_P944 [Nonomuraea gerenzanensis]
MPTLEDQLRQLMTDETARLRAAPDLMERVVRADRDRRRRARAAVVAACVAASVIAVGTPFVYLNTGSAGPAGQRATTSAVPEPPAIDDLPPVRTEPEDLGDLGDGREFGHVRVGYLPKRLVWGGSSVDNGDSYSTSYFYKGDDEGSYRVGIFMWEKTAVSDLEERLQRYRDEEEGQDVTVGGRSGYLIVTNVGEDGMAGTPTLFLKLADQQWAEIFFSPVYVKEYSGPEAVTAELKKIGEGLTSTL